MATKLDWKILRGAKDYRTFLKAYLEERDQSLSDLARAAGFGRGFPGDIIAGKRRMTARSLYSFEKAMKVPSFGKKLFRLLVAKEEPDVLPELDRTKLASQIDALRSRPWSGTRREVGSRGASDVQRIFRSGDATKVYAASGQPERGATFDEIQQRTRLDERRLVAAVKSLEEAGLLKLDPTLKQYIPQDLHLFFKTDDSGKFLIELFQKACLHAGRRIPEAVTSNQEMFFSSSFCVSEKNLPELKAALRETILRFVDDSVEPHGDRVANLVVALHL